MADKTKEFQGIIPWELASELSTEDILALTAEGWMPPMAGGAVPDLNVFDVYQQAAITDLVRRNLLTVLETIPAMGDQIAPLTPVYDRTIKREIAEVAAFGLGQFRAPDATPKIYVPKLAFTQEVSELLLLDEQTPIKEDQWLRMTSPDSSIRARAGVDLVTQGRILQMRAEHLTEFMRWQMFLGNTMTVNFDNVGGTSTQSVAVTWPYMSSHKVTAAVPWSDRVNSTPIDDLRSWQQIIANDIGVYASKIHMNSITFSRLQRSNQARGYLTQTDRNVFLPTAADIETLLWGGTGTPTDNQGRGVAPTPQIIVSDAGYRDVTAGYNRGMSALTKYLPNGTVLLTVEYIHEGERIADVADGMVALSVSFNELKWVQGPQSEIIIDHGSKTHFFRQACARFPRLRRPEGFLSATTG